MPFELSSELLAQVSAAAAEESDACDRTGAFPNVALGALADLGVTGDPPLMAGRSRDLLWLLAAAGRGDLSVGRILEGHVNALYLIARFANPHQQQVYGDVTRASGLFGVWNTDDPERPLTLVDGRLRGRKIFCTGADGLSYALVTIEQKGGRTMMIVPLADLPVDRTWWRPMGMRASGSHIVDFSGLHVEHGWHLGRPGDYIAEPWFTAGAMRFLAVQVGGMHGILDIVRRHLRSTNRDGDAHQRHRLGQMATAVESGYNWLDRAASSWTNAERGSTCAQVRAEAMATVNAARGAVESAAMTVLELAERSVGAAGLIAPHPLERKIRDLRTYLRQPNPDGALAAFGSAVATGDWEAGSRLSPESDDR